MFVTLVFSLIFSLNYLNLLIFKDFFVGLLTIKAYSFTELVFGVGKNKTYFKKIPIAKHSRNKGKVQTCFLVFSLNITLI